MFSLVVAPIVSWLIIICCCLLFFVSGAFCDRTLFLGLGYGLGGLFIYKGLPTAAVAVAWALAGVSYGKPVGQDAEALGEYTLRGAMIVFRTTGVLLGLTAIAHGAMYARIRKKLMIENELKRSSRPQWTKGAPPAATASPIRTPKSLRPSTIRTPRSFGPRFAYFAFAGFWGRGYIMGVYGTPCG